ncbi:hypothetical protein [Actinophytocola algeriensis]|uniref:ML domain-containing protein n=1 Tax=Actinophytocola algeriensis TaxID=1768010 RepID=A0A7W7VDF7_9PSEU|nr:hypothetical protein [Actinophytocola algeriensis]MBB4906044.1 hypothetical protein [Actinophytocola algeriensis]MBE1472271.1 hypothetical protein [Actinophytocola algeriensis]
MNLRTGAIGLRTRAVAAAVMLTAGLMGMLTATGASADPIGTCGAVSKFTMTFKTGGDDLRYNSELIVAIKVSGITEPIPLNPVFGQFSNHTTTVKANITFATTGLTVNSCSIRGQELTLVSHPNGWEGPDNWDMNSFSIVGHTSAGVAKYQNHSGPGFPRFRFTQSNPTLFVNDPV